MKRQWNWVIGEPGSGAAFARALGLVCSRPVIDTFAAVHAEVLAGRTVRITAERAKLDANGQRIEDVKNVPGEYVTLGYTVEVDGGEWGIDREPEWEGEPSAVTIGDALAGEADRDFCEAMMQAKCLFDRIGGQLFLRPYIREGQVVGVLAHYEHIGGREADASLTEPIELPGEPDGEGDAEPEPVDAGVADAETPEEMAAELEAERV